VTVPAVEEDDQPIASIRIELIDPDAMKLWRTVAKVAAAFGEDRRWCLVGGLMVALFAIEARQAQRATTDIDVLADARARPSGTAWATGRLEALGATLHEPQEFEREHGFRFALDGQIVDVLASDGLGRSGAITTGKLQTIQIPGGTQALKRIEVVEIVVDGDSVRLRRPTLIAAILLKARSLRVHSRPDDQRLSRPDGLTRLSSIRRSHPTGWWGVAASFRIGAGPSLRDRSTACSRYLGSRKAGRRGPPARHLA
jgi:hypothetical protein